MMNSERDSDMIETIYHNHEISGSYILGEAVGLLGLLDALGHSFPFAVFASYLVLNGPAMVAGVFSLAFITLQIPFLSLITT